MSTTHWMPQYCPATRPRPGVGVGSRLEVVVVHTAIPATLQALKTAAALAKGLAARIRLLVPQVVPYPLPLAEPPLPTSFRERRFRTVAEGMAVETAVEIVACRDICSALEAVLRPRSLVVLGERGSGWARMGRPSAETRLAQRLRTLGHQVVFADWQ